MGMNAVYMMIDDSTLDAWMKLESNDLLNAILEKEEEVGTEVFDLAKEWDIVHYYLTGESASTPIEGDKLSEAIVGVHVFSYDEEADFISCTENGELSEIIKALKSFDADAYQSRLDKELVKAKQLYPEGVEETDGLLELIKDELKHLTSFYDKALTAKMHVVVSVV